MPMASANPTLDAVKLSLAITVDDFDLEISDLIDAALLDLGIAGVEGYTQGDKLVLQAVKTYCRAHFQSPADYDRLKASYDEQKAQLMNATGYTKWVEEEVLIETIPDEVVEDGQG